MALQCLCRVSSPASLGLLPILLGACTSPAGDRFEARLQQLEARLADLDKSLAALEGHVGIGNRNARVLPARIEKVWWDGRYHRPVYRGPIEIREQPVGPLPAGTTGLACAPDGRIAASVGRGSHREMRIFYWDPSGTFRPVVELQYAPRMDRQDRRAREEAGVFGFFAGPVALDAAGTCYFSLGMVSPNGIYRVESTDPVRITKLHEVEGTYALQIPGFDPEHLYSTSWNGVFRLPMTPSGPGPSGNPWFHVSGSGLSLAHTLILSETRVIACLMRRTPPDPRGRPPETTALLFDRERGEYWSLPFDDFGPLAVSTDGKRTIRFDPAAGTICEFELPGPP